MIEEKIVIIGAGPAGIACAIQLKRQGITPVIFEKYEIGGLLSNANLVENYPGFPDGISGPSLINKFEVHLQKYEIDVVKSEVQNVEYSGNKFFLQTESGNYSTLTLIIASGTIPVKSETIDISPEAFSKVFYEIDQLRNISGETFVIVGAGDCAFDYALNLSAKNNVVILNRSNNVKCLPLLFDRSNANQNIKYYSEKSISNVELNNDILNIHCMDGSVVLANNLIFALGRKPNMKFLGKSIFDNISDLKNQNRLYFIGDVINGLFRQLSISTGNGVKAAMEISKEFPHAI